MAQLQGAHLLNRTRAGYLVMKKVMMKHAGLGLFSQVKREASMLFMVAALLVGGHAGASKPAPTPGHPTLLSPHSDPIAVHGGQVFVVNTPADTLDVVDASRR